MPPMEREPQIHIKLPLAVRLLIVVVILVLVGIAAHAMFVDFAVIMVSILRHCCT